jgi:NitT/TauT family transport system substrate-binding protein
MKKTRKLLVTGVALIGLFGMTACSQAPVASGDPGSDSKSRDVNVIVSTIVDSSPVYIAEERGFFKDAGLNVTIAAAPTPGARIPSLVSGAADFALVGTADVVQAASAGVDLRATGQSTQTTQTPAKDTGKVYVAAGSDITKAADLNGRVVAVGGLGGGGELSLRAALDIAGADSTKIKFLEVPFDSMLNTLTTGQVDAISAVAPFTIAAEEAGAKWLMSPGAVAMPGAAQQLIVSTGKYLDGNAETAKLFMEAINKAITLAADEPDVVREILPKFSKTPAALAEKMDLPEFNPELTEKKLRMWSDLMFKYEFVKNELDVAKLMTTGL